MTFKVDERIRETSTTTGTGTYTLAGPPTGFQPVSALGANNYLPYYATDGVNWEAGIGRYLSGPDRLERTHILASSNADAAVSWGAGTRTLRCSLGAALSLPRYLSKGVGGGAGTTILSILEQRASVIELTGTLTGARVIEVDDTPGTYVVYNNTTGAFALTFRKTGGTGLVLPQGFRGRLYNDGTDIRIAGNFTASNGSEFTTGTKSTFNQTAAPVLWTKDTTHNDKALRAVSGTVGSGGGTAFTSVFGAGKSSSGHTLATSEIPAHPHTFQAFNDTGGTNGPRGADATPSGTGTTNNAGGGGSHAHGLSLDLHYVDVIIATKD